MLTLVLFSFFISFLFFIFRFFIYKRINSKYSKGIYQVYECGFSEINNIANFYTLLFYIVALSFMLFDIEIILFMPYIYIIFFSFNTKLIVFFFFFFLIVRLCYEIYYNIF